MFLFSTLLIYQQIDYVYRMGASTTTNGHHHHHNTQPPGQRAQSTPNCASASMPREGAFAPTASGAVILFYFKYNILLLVFIVLYVVYIMSVLSNTTEFIILWI